MSYARRALHCARWAGVVALLAAAGGCATSGESSRVERTVPPPVTDHTVDPDVNAAPAIQAHVAVTFEAERPSAIRTDGADALVTTAGRRCYRLALQKDASLEGNALYELLVTSNGRVAGVEMVSTTAASARLETCVESVLGRLRFDVPPTRDPVASRLYVRLVLRRELIDTKRSPLDQTPAPDD